MPGSIPQVTRIEPVPLAPEESPKPQQSSLYIRFNSLIPALQSVQKYSSYTFTAFSFIHGVSVIGAPSISVSLAEDMISMGRQLYQDSGLEWFLVWGSLGAHILSGFGIRIIRNLLYRWKYGEKRSDGRKRRNLFQAHSMNDIKDEEAGLTGGITGYAGLPPKKSFISRALGLTPLQFSGYLSVPLVCYHAFQLRVVPLVVEGDSSYISLEYVKHIFSFDQPIWRPLLNWVIYPTMILLTTYHTIYGLLFWNEVKNLKLRKLAMNIISLTSLCGIWSLYMIQKMDSHLPRFLTTRFDGYLEKFYWF